MAYDPGALEAALAAAVGEEPGLIAELRQAFFGSAELHCIALRNAASLAEWHGASQRLKSLAASFGARRVMDAAQAAAGAPRGDAATLLRVERALAALRAETGANEA